MFQIIKKLKFLLDDRTRKIAFILMGMILVMGFMEMAGIASIMPFIAVLTNPDLVQTNFFLNSLYNFFKSFGVKDDYDFIFSLGILVFLILIFSLSFKALTSYLQLRFVKKCEYIIGRRLVESYLNQPYTWFLNRNSADLGKSILSEANFVIDHGISPMVNVVAQGTVVLAILSLLLFIDYKIVIIVGFIYSIVYSLIYLSVKNLLSSLGKNRVIQNLKRFTVVSETFSSIKEIKVTGLENLRIKEFARPAENLAKIESLSKILSHIPRYGIEAISFGGILLTILIYMRINDDFVNVLPIITLYAFAGYRLIPSLQQIYVSLTYLRAVRTSLDLLYKDLKNLENKSNLIDSKNYNLEFKKEIQLENISYSYPNSPVNVLKNINLKIPFGSSVGLVGSTGSGKTTLVDVLLGLLEPNNGNFKVDDINIFKKNYNQWQKNVGYVPQNIYLSDDTILSNIAFGIEPDDIDKEKVIKVAKIALLDEFIQNELPNKYDTIVGERGVRLSGGQRQRIGIARALYRSPKLLILDEATSALDNLTEKKVIDLIYKIDQITIISIAHRLSTLENCDEIYELNKGSISSKIRFDQLIKNNIK